MAPWHRAACLCGIAALMFSGISRACHPSVVWQQGEGGIGCSFESVEISKKRLIGHKEDTLSLRGVFKR